MRDTILIPRDLARQVELLCEWIAETPHQRGSINGQAAQVHHAVSQALAAAPQPAQETDAQKLATAIAEAATRAGITDASQHSFSGPQLLMLLDDLAEMAAPPPAQQDPLLAAIRAEPTEMIYKGRVLELVKEYTPQPAQEPANLCPYTDDEDGKRDAWIEGWESAQTAALEAPQPAQEPVAWRYRELAEDRWEVTDIDPSRCAEVVEPLYTTPPQRQPLTDEFVRLVVRSKQPHLSTESKAWKDLFASCKYWLEAAHGIGDKQ